MSTLAAVDLVRVAHVCEDHAANWHGVQPSGFVFSRWDCERYLTEGYLSGLYRGEGRCDFGQVWAAVSAHLDAHPEILAAGRVTDGQRAERQAARDARAAELLGEAAAVFRSGDVDRAEELIGLAELASPDFGSLARARRAVARHRGQKVA